MQEQTSPAPSPHSPTTANQPASVSTSSSPEVVTSVATTTSVTSGGVYSLQRYVPTGWSICYNLYSHMSTSIVPTTVGLRRSEASSRVPHSPSSLQASPASSSAATPIVPTTGGLRRSDTGSPVPSTPSSPPTSPASSSAATSIVPTTGGQGESGASAGVAAGVAVGLVLAVVVVGVVVAIVLAAVCSVRRRKKYVLSSIVTYEVPPDTHIGKLVGFCTLHAQTATNCSPASSPTFPSLTAANCCTEAAPYEIIPLSNGKGSPDGVYDVPCDMDEPKYSDAPFAYDVPCSSTLPLVYETVSDDNAAENMMLQEKPYYNMGCHGNGVLTTDGSEHEYQEADTVPQRTRPLLEVSVRVC